MILVAGQIATWLRHMHCARHHCSSLQWRKVFGWPEVAPCSDDPARYPFYEHMLIEDSSSKRLFLNTEAAAVQAAHVR